MGTNVMDMDSTSSSIAVGTEKFAVEPSGELEIADAATPVSDDIGLQFNPDNENGEVGLIKLIKTQNGAAFTEWTLELFNKSTMAVEDLIFSEPGITQDYIRNMTTPIPFHTNDAPPTGIIYAKVTATAGGGGGSSDKWQIILSGFKAK